MSKVRKGPGVVLALVAFSIALALLSGLRRESAAAPPAYMVCAYCPGTYPCYSGACCCVEYYPNICACSAGCFTCGCSGSFGWFGGDCPGGPAQQ